MLSSSVLTVNFHKERAVYRIVADTSARNGQQRSASVLSRQGGQKVKEC
jgi:hypothetical protein